MERQGFDPIEHALNEVVDFMENIESTEDLIRVENKSKPKADKKKSKTTSASDGGQKKPPHYCSHHGANWTHDTADCHVLKNNSNGNGNKTWSRKAAEANDKSKKELATLIAKTVKAMVKNQLASVDKKRKSSSSEDDNDCFLVDSLTKGLDGFNYKDDELQAQNFKYVDWSQLSNYLK